MTVDILLLRHGRTTQPGTFTGAADVALGRDGEKQVLGISPLLEAARIDRCYCSPLARCRQTLRLLALDCETVFDDALKEIDFGLWEGLDYEQILHAYPDEVKRWDELRDGYTFPGGESIGRFKFRVRRWFEELAKTRHNRVLVIAHGGVLREGMGALLNLDADGAFAFNFAEGAVTRITIREGYPCLEYFNYRG